MKNYASVGHAETAAPQLPLPRESPPRPGPLQLPSRESNFGSGPSASGSGEREESAEGLLTERTGGTSEVAAGKEARTSNIKTYLRIRPCTPSPLLQLLAPHTVAYERTHYKFDCIFEAGAPQARVFAEAGREAAATFLEGYNATIFAYGSTGSGKTYTMFGDDDGLVPSVVREIFARAAAGARLSCSMIEIYRESLIDLLSAGGPELKIKDAGSSSCVVHNLSSHAIASEADALALVKRGNILKKIRETDLNECSSRSHVVFTLVMQRADAEGRALECRFNLVDLAGSEKVGKSKVQGEGLEEAKKINLSLSCLGNTISALVRGSDHVPFRESKLTRILKESLIGRSLTRLIVTCSLADDALEDTISSMKFAQRAQKVQTQAEIAYSRGKGEREDRLRCLQGAVDRLEADVARISLVLSRQPCECGNCAEVRAILSRKASLPVFSFHPLPLPSYKSPKQADKAYFSNASLEKGKSFSFLKTACHSWQDGSADRDAFRKLTDLRAENERLREEKLRLEMRVRALEERAADKEKEKDKEKGKKVIRLGERPSKINKENQMGLANCAERPKGERREEGREKDLFLQMQAESEPPCLKEHDCQQTLQLIQSAVSKLEAACTDYRTALYPLHLDILNQQIALLHVKLSSSYSPLSPLSQQPARISGMLVALQKRLCSYVDSVGDIVPRLLEGSRCEGRQELSEALQEKLREVSDIKWCFKEFYEEPEDLEAIADLLRPLSSRPLSDNNCHLSLASVGSGENQFLDLNPASFQPILHEPLRAL